MLLKNNFFFFEKVENNLNTHKDICKWEKRIRLMDALKVFVNSL